MPSNEPEDLRAALRRIESRLAQMESRLTTLEKSRTSPLIKDLEDLTPQPPPAPKTVPPLEPQPPTIQPAEEQIYDVALESVETEPPPPEPETPPVVTPPPFQTVPPERSRAAAFVAKQKPPAPPPPRSQPSLENTIGKSIASWAGGLLVLGAVLFALKLAWDYGYIPPPSVRIAIGVLFGIALVAIGEFAFIKKMNALAASLAATGLATLMATLFAANVAFTDPVLSRETAFAGTIVVGAIGIALALHMRQMALAILALIGMYITPMILSSGQDKSVQLLVFITLVTATGLILSFFKTRWIPVRVLAFICGWLWLLGWSAFGKVAAHVELGLTITALFFVMFLAELLLSLTRVLRTTGPTPLDAKPQSSLAALLESGAAVLSFANSGFTLFIFTIIFDRADLPRLWIIPLVLSAAMTLTVFATRSKLLSLAAAVQALAYLAVAIPLYFDGPSTTLAYAALGLAHAIYTNRTGSMFSRIWSIIMLAIVAIRVITFDALNDDLHHTLFKIGTQSFTKWSLLGWGAAFYALAIAWLDRPRLAPRPDQTFDPVGREWATLTAIIFGSALAAITSVATLHTEYFTLATLLWTLILVAFGRISVPPARALGIDTITMGILGIAAAKWALTDGFMLSVADVPPGSYVLPFINLFTLNAILIIAAVLTVRILKSAGHHVVAWTVTLITFLWLNVEVLRATDAWLHPLLAKSGAAPDPWILKNVVISILWGLIGLIAIQVGFSKKSAPIRYVALFLLGITVLKVLLIDMANVQTILRVLSFLATGIALLLVSLAYHKWARKTATAP
jgi:uncharacterized membrane protein